MHKRKTFLVYTRRFFGGTAFLPILLLFSGCTPTREQIFQYETILAIMGFGLGLGIWALGKWLNPLKRPTSESGSPDDHIESLETPIPYNPLTRKRTLIVAAVLGIATYGLLSLPWFIVRWFNIEITCPKWDRVVDVPLFFAFIGFEKPFLGIGMFFYSYHLPIFMSNVPFLKQVMEYCPYAACPFILMPFIFYWYIGLRHWREGWLIPLIVAFFSLMTSIFGYCS